MATTNTETTPYMHAPTDLVDAWCIASYHGYTEDCKLLPFVSNAFYTEIIVPTKKLRYGGKGRTILQGLVREADIYNVQLLARAGDDVTVVDTDGQTPLHLAASGEKDLEYLLKKSSSPPEKFHEGKGNEGNDNVPSPTSTSTTSSSTTSSSTITTTTTSSTTPQERGGKAAALAKLREEHPAHARFFALQRSLSTPASLTPPPSSSSLSSATTTTTTTTTDDDDDDDDDAKKLEYLTLLHNLEAKHEALVRILLPLLDKQQGVGGGDVNVRDMQGRTPLMHASQYGNEAVCRLLLAKGAKVNEKDTVNGYGPLFLASLNGHENICKLLLSQPGTNIDIRCHQNNTPLLGAAILGHEAVCQLLLDRGADINASNDMQETVFIAAVKGNHEGVCRLLLQAAESSAMTTNISSSSSSSEEEKSGARRKSEMVNCQAHRAEEFTPIYWAIENQNESIVRLLLDHGAKIDSSIHDFSGLTPLQFAVTTGEGKNEGIVTALLEAAAACYAKGGGKGKGGGVGGRNSSVVVGAGGASTASSSSATTTPSTTPSTTTTKTPLTFSFAHKENKDNDDPPFPPHLLLASVTASSSLSSISPAALTNTPNSRGMTALTIAIRENNEALIRVLIRKGHGIISDRDWIPSTIARNAMPLFARGDIQIEDPHATPQHVHPLSYAISQHREWLAIMLIEEAGANVNAHVNVSQESFLVAAEKAGLDAVVDCLLRHGATKK